jgi:Vitamin K epoxide reductase family
MSNPILSPHHQNVIRTEGGTPLTLLTSGYPPGAISSVIGLFVLGASLAACPLMFGYVEHAQAVSDWISAVLVLVLGVVALITRRPWVSWIAGSIGLWLVFAPVLLWSPTLAAYVVDSLVGSAIVAVGLLEPLGRRLPGPDIPDGWSYNPSTWSQRVPVILLSGLSFILAAYLATFQFGHIDSVWDPLFGDGTERVLTSEVSRAWPVSDAALGAGTYLLDLLMTCAGDQRRWRTMPWLVILFGILIIPVGIVSIVLVILQPIAVGAWCGWCLITAAATLVMIPLAIDEVAATLQLLRRVHRDGHSWWSVLWRGAAEGGSFAPVEPRRPNALPPWTLAALVAAGLWVMIVPSILETTGGSEVSAYLVGALVIVIAVTAASEVARAVRLVAIPLGLWIAIAPWILSGSTSASRGSGLLTGLVIVAASLPRGIIGERRATVDRLAVWPSRSIASS